MVMSRMWNQESWIRSLDLPETRNATLAEPSANETGIGPRGEL